MTSLLNENHYPWLLFWCEINRGVSVSGEGSVSCKQYFNPPISIVWLGDKCCLQNTNTAKKSREGSQKLRGVIIDCYTTQSAVESFWLLARAWWLSVQNVDQLVCTTLLHPHNYPLWYDPLQCLEGDFQSISQSISQSINPRFINGMVILVLSNWGVYLCMYASPGSV